MAGVGTTPAASTSPPALRMPATRALSSSTPEVRGSRPTTTAGRPDPAGPSARRTPTAARPRARASSGVRSALARPRTPSVPNSFPTGALPADPSALAVLGSLAGLLEAVLLALDLAGVAGEEATLLQLRPQLDVEVDQGPGDGVAQGAGLAGDPAAVEVGEHVVALEGVGDPQRLGDEPAVGRVGEVVLEGASVELERARPLDQPHPDHGLLAPAGAPGELCWSSQRGVLLSFLLDGRPDVQRPRHLRGVRVGGAVVDLELGEHLPPEPVAGQHPADGLLDRAGGPLGQQDRVRGGLEAARVAGVAVGDLLLELAPGEPHLGRVDDDHVVAGVDVGRVDRLVLAPQDAGDLGGQPAKDLAVGVDDVPVAGQVPRARRERSACWRRHAGNSVTIRKMWRRAMRSCRSVE